jgi:hypothetical protein
MDFLRCSVLDASFSPSVECGIACTPIPDAKRIAEKMTNHGEFGGPTTACHPIDPEAHLVD